MSILSSGHRQHDEQVRHRIDLLALRDVRADLEQRPSPEHAAERPVEARVIAGTKVVRPRANAELLERVEGHVEEVLHALIVEIKRLTQLQEQMNEARKAIRELKNSR